MKRTFFPFLMVLVFMFVIACDPRPTATNDIHSGDSDSTAVKQDSVTVEKDSLQTK